MMNQRIRVSKAIGYILTTSCLFLFFLIWPLGVLENTQTSRSRENILRESEPISVENNGTQKFITQGSYLESVQLYVQNDMAGEMITFRLYDKAYQQIWETFYVVGTGERFPGFIRIPVEMEVEEGQEHYYTVEGLTREMILCYEDTAESGIQVYGNSFYGGKELEGVNLIARMRYVRPFSEKEVFGILLILLLLSFVGGKTGELLFTTKLSSLDREVRLQTLVQWTGNPLVITLSTVLLLQIFPGRVFGVGVINYGFYYLGILLATAVLLYGINHKREEETLWIMAKGRKKEWTFWVMSACFAGVLWSCFEYMNGLYDIHHQYAACRMLIWFSLVLICTFRFQRGELLTVYNLIYLVLASMAGYAYAKPYQGIEEQDELYKLQAQVMVIGGFVLLQLVITVMKKLVKRKKGGALFLPYTLFAAVFLILLVLFSNDRAWTKLLAAVFAVFYFRMWIWEHRDKLLGIFGNGLILNFLNMIVYSLLHRPYLRFRHNRYGMGFHTVTMTGYYLALVLCVVAARLFVRYRETGRWQSAWKEFSLLGIGNVYLFLTLSRTGYLAAFVMEVFVLVLMSLSGRKDRLKRLLTAAGLFAGVSLWFFPIVFTAQRIVPAIVNEPVYTEFEVWEYTTKKTTRPDSELYIDITAFVKVAKNKLFGVDMGNISLSSLLDRLEPVYAQRRDSLLVSTDPEIEEEKDISNGRFDIFRAYISHWNVLGHEEMGVPLENGEISVHAHNTFLQVIHDHGLVTGMIFLLFVLFSFFLGMYRFWKAKKSRPDLILVPALVMAFAAAGMVEWIYHICNPFGFSLMITITPLLFDTKVKKV